MIKIILNEDIKNLGGKNKILDVSNGYARNYLLPKKLAILATEKNINQLKLKEKYILEKQNNELLEAKNIFKIIENKSLIIETKIGSNEKLFGSITSREISKEIEKQFNVKINKKIINLEKNINKYGTYQINIKLYKNIVSKIKIIVMKKEQKKC